MIHPDSAASVESHLFAGPIATITAVVPMDDDPNLRAIHVDGTRRCIVRAADVDDLGLAADIPWSDALADEVTIRAQRVESRRRALQLLGRKAYSTRQLRDKLASRFDIDIADAAVNELAGDGWIDDRAVAADLIEAVLNRGPAGPNLLREKLCAAGIEADLADDVIAASIHDDEQFERTVSYLTRQSRSTSIAADIFTRRLANRLARRGLEADFIVRCFAAAGLTMSSDEACTDDAEDSP